MLFRYSIGVVAAITTILALLIANLSFVLSLFAVEVVFIFIVVEVLVRNMPMRLRESSKDNGVRVDGSWSKHRAAVEYRALRKMRYDLLAVLLIVAITGNWFAFFVHEIIPIPLAAKAMQVFDLDPVVWKQGLREHQIDQDFEQWSALKTPTDRAGIQLQQELLWHSWPLVILIGLVWLFGSFAFVKSSHQKILREFALGVSARAESNLNRDITRLQS